VGDYLEERWAGHEEKLKELISIIGADADWHKSEPYKVLMDSLGPLPKHIEAVERDLRGADLSGAHLDGASLSRATLWGTNLSEANLSGAHVVQANLSRTILSQANLSRTDLRGVAP
jgi:uncharacterized protein YjbI with pentapeptide repeats